MEVTKTEIITHEVKSSASSDRTYGPVAGSSHGCGESKLPFANISEIDLGKVEIDNEYEFTIINPNACKKDEIYEIMNVKTLKFYMIGNKYKIEDCDVHDGYLISNGKQKFHFCNSLVYDKSVVQEWWNERTYLRVNVSDLDNVFNNRSTFEFDIHSYNGKCRFWLTLLYPSGYLVDQSLLNKYILEYNYYTFDVLKPIKQNCVPSKNELEAEANEQRIKRSLEAPKKFSKTIKNKQHKPKMHYPKKTCWMEETRRPCFNGVSSRVKNLLKKYLELDKITPSVVIESDVTLDEAIQLFGSVENYATFRLSGFGYTRELPQTRRLTPYSRIFDPAMYTGNLSQAYEDALIWHYDHNDHHPEYWIGNFTTSEKMSFKATLHLLNDLLISGLRLKPSPYESLCEIRKWMFKNEDGFYKIQPKFASMNANAVVAWMSRVIKFGVSANEVYHHRDHVAWRDVEPKIGEMKDTENFLKKPTWPRFFELTSKYPKLHHFLQETYSHIRDVNALNTIFNILEPHDNDKLEIRSLVSYYYKWSLEKHINKPIPTAGDSEMNNHERPLDVESGYLDLMRDCPELVPYFTDMGTVTPDDADLIASNPEFAFAYQKVAPATIDAEGWVKRLLSKIPGFDLVSRWIKEIFQTVFNTASKTVSSVVENILKPITTALSSVLQYFKTFVGKTGEALSFLVNPCYKIMEFIQDFFNTSIDYIRNIDWFEIVKFLVLIMLFNKTTGMIRNMVSIYLLYNVFGKIKKFEEFKILFHSFSNDTEIPTSSGEDDTSLLASIISYFTEKNLKGIGKVIAIFLFITMGVTILSSEYTNVGKKFMENMKNMHFLGAGLFGLERIFKYIPAFFETCWQYGRKMCGFESDDDKKLKLNQANAKMIAEWISTISLYDTTAGKSLIVMDPEHSAKIPALYSTSVELYKRAQLGEFQPEVNRAITQNFRKVISIYNTWFQSTSNSRPRKTPFHVQFVGEPGVGKTTLLTIMKNWLKETYYSKVNENKLSYHRGNTKHWDGWENQPITIYDEAFKYKDPEIISEMLCLVSNSPTLLPSASLDTKGINYFNSEWILSTTNVKYPTCPDVYCIAAIQRRRHLLVEVTIDNRVLDPSTHKFDMALFEKFYPDQRSDECPHLRFHLKPSVNPDYEPNKNSPEPVFTENMDNSVNESTPEEVPRPPGVDPPTQNLTFEDFLRVVQKRRTAMVSEEEIIIGKTTTYMEKLTEARNQLLAYMMTMKEEENYVVGSEICKLNEWHDYYTKPEEALIPNTSLHQAAATVNQISITPTNNILERIQQMRKSGSSCYQRRNYRYFPEDVFLRDPETGCLRVRIVDPYTVNTRMIDQGEMFDLMEINTKVYSPIYYGTPKSMNINGVMVEKWQTTEMDCLLLKYTTTTKGVTHITLPKWYVEKIYNVYMGLDKDTKPIYYKGYPLGRDNLTFSQFLFTIPLFRDHLAQFQSLSKHDRQIVLEDAKYQLYHQLFRKKIRNVYDNAKAIYKRTYGLVSGGLGWFFNKMQLFYKNNFTKILFSIFVALGLSYGMYTMASYFFPHPQETSRYVFKSPVKSLSLTPTSRDMDSMALKISRNLFEVRIGSGKSCVAVGYRSHYFLLPYHCVRSYLERNSEIPLQLLPTRNSTEFWHAVVSPENFKLIPGTDTVVMFCDKFNMVRDISANFRKLDTIDKYWHDGVTLMYPLDGMVYQKEATFSRILNNKVYHVEGKTNYSRIAVYDYEAPRGSSGGLVLSEDPTGSHRVILGMQSFRMNNESYASVLTFDEIEDVIETFQPFVKTSSYMGDCDEDIIPTCSKYLEGHISIIGKLPNHQQVYLPNKTKFENTTISKHLTQYETDWIPAILSQDDLRVPSGTHILQHSINKCARDVIREPPLRIQKMAVEGICMYFGSYLEMDKLRKYTIYEASRGPRAEGVIENKTSPGLPWVHYPGKLPGKKSWVNHTEDGFTILDEEIITYNNKQYELFSRGHVVAGNMYDFPKDELRPEKKALGPPVKTRSITVQDFSVSLLWRRLFLSLEGQLHQKSNGLYIFAPGMNPESVHWNNLYHRMLEVSHLGSDFDVGNWDGHFPAWLMWLSRDVACSLMNYTPGTEEWMVTTSILHYTLFGYAQFGDCLYQKHRGLTSGFAGTTSINTIGHMLLFYIFFILLSERNGFHITDFSTFIKNVSLIIYNDDILFTVSDQIRDWFNAVTISELYESYGWPITAGDKNSEIKPFKHLSECTFLKRHFNPDPNISYLIWAPIDLKVVHNLLHWIRRTTDMKQQLYDNIINVYYFLVAHGRKTFNLYQKDINLALKKSGNRIFLTSFDTIKEDFLERYIDTNSFIKQGDFDEYEPFHVV